MRSRARRICTDRLGDVVELQLAAILEANVQLAFDFAVHLLGNQNAARIGDPHRRTAMLMPSPEITVLPNDNVTKVEPDAYKLGPQAVSELGPFIPQERTC